MNGRRSSGWAYAAVATNLNAAVVMIGVLARGLPAGESSLTTRMEYVRAHATVWRLGWVTWHVAAIALLALFVVLSRLWSERAPIVVRLALICATAGLAADLAAQTMLMAVSPRAGHDDFRLIESIAVPLSGYLGNGLYTVGGALLTWAGRRDLPRALLGLGAAVWASGFALSAAALIGSERGQVVGGSILILLFIAWSALVGRWLGRRE